MSVHILSVCVCVFMCMPVSTHHPTLKNMCTQILQLMQPFYMELEILLNAGKRELSFFQEENGCGA